MDLPQRGSVESEVGEGKRDRISPEYTVELIQPGKLLAGCWCKSGNESALFEL